MFIAALFTIAKTWKQPRCPLTDDWVRKMWNIYTREYYSAIKKEWNDAICSNMEGTRESHSEWSKSERERQIPHDITYIWNLIYHTNETFQRKENHGLGGQTCGCRGGRGGSGMDGEFGVGRCKLRHRDWISREVLPYSTGNSIQSLGIDQDGR